MNAIELQIAKVLPEIFEDYPAAMPLEQRHNEVIPEGQRDHTLTQIAGKLRRVGFPVETIAAALHVENRRRCSVPLTEFEVEKIARSVARYPVTKREPLALLGLSLQQLTDPVFPDRRALLTRHASAVFREGQTGQVYAERGFGKTWFLQTLALIAAAGSEALGFCAPEPCRVVYIDGEMASHEIRGRFELLRERLHIPQTAPLTVVGADWQEQFLPRLDTDAGQAAVEPFIEAADLVILDNRSCLFDPEAEKDPSAWQPAQDWLLSLRRRGKATLIAHHSNRQGGARGHSKAEDMMNILVKLTRPEDYRQDQGARFVVTFDKSRGVYGSAVAPFLAHLTPDGWRTQAIDQQHEQHTTDDKLVEYVRLAHRAGERPKSANAAIVGARVNRQAGLKSWADLLHSGAIVKHPEGGFYAE